MKSGGRTAALSAALAAIAVFAFGSAYGARAAGGADAFGYVSQAYLWLQGDLEIEQPLSREFPWPHQEQSLTPLGYRPGEIRHTIVPTYAPGLPLIMAAFHRAAGACGPFYVTPVFGALLVAGTFLLAARATRETTIGAIAAVLMAGSPAFLFNLMVPMSDIATAALWTWAIALLTWRGAVPAFAAGLAAGLAIVVRPNLVPLALAGVLGAALWPDEADDSFRRRAMRIAAFAAGVIPASLFIAAVNQRLYGSPLESGYGPTSSLYALAHLPTNATQFAMWLVQSESVFLLAALAPLAVPAIRPSPSSGRSWIPLLAAVAIVFGSYLFYLPFPEWWYLRFLLPAFPILFLALAATIVWLARAAAPYVPPHVVFAVVVLAVVVYRGWFAYDRGLMRIGQDEARYAAIGQYIDRALPANAVVLTMQHSGTVRLYSGRLTIRYDAFSEGRFPSVIEWLQARGYRPYILLEDWEEKEYRARFGDATPLARLEIRVLAEMTAPVKVRIYDPLPSRGGDPPPDPIVLRAWRSCAAPRGVWAVTD